MVCGQVGVVSIMDLVKLPSLWFWVEPEGGALPSGYARSIRVDQVPVTTACSRLFQVGRHLSIPPGTHPPC